MKNIETNVKQMELLTKDELQNLQGGVYVRSISKNEGVDLKGWNSCCNTTTVDPEKVKHK